MCSLDGTRMCLAQWSVDRVVDGDEGTIEDPVPAPPSAPTLDIEFKEN